MIRLATPIFEHAHPKKFWSTILVSRTRYSQIWDLCRNTANNITFHYRTNLVKIIKFINKFKKTRFWPIFGQFSQILRQKIFSKKIWKLCRTSYGFLAPCQNLEKTSYTISRKCPNRQKYGQKDKQTLFYRTLMVGFQHIDWTENLLRKLDRQNCFLKWLQHLLKKQVMFFYDFEK